MGVDELVPAYLARLGVEREPPSFDALVRLHHAHVERVPYETVWLHAGERRNTDPVASFKRMATTDRGGYCYHLNGAFSVLLRALGYDVARHVGGVHGPDGPSELSMTNHLVLTVRGLPIDDNAGGAWFVDGGLGDALHEPLPLVDGTYAQGPYRYRFERVADGPGDWHFTHDPQGSFSGMNFRAARTGMSAFSDMHTFLSTSPDSGFVKILSVQTRDATGADIMRGLELHRSGLPARDKQVLDRRDDWFGALADLFRMPLAGYSAARKDRLWARLYGAHQHWVDSQA